MTLLEALRLIQEAGPPSGDMDQCICCGSRALDEHALDCPWMAMPKIVAALEAAERVTCQVCGALSMGECNVWKHVGGQTGRIGPDLAIFGDTKVAPSNDRESPH